MPVKLIIFIILILIFTIFAVKNMGMVEVRFYDFSLNPYSFRMPLVAVISVSLSFGIIIAWIYGWVDKIKLRSIIHRNNRTIEVLDDELRKYKKPTLPEYTESDR